MWGLTLTLILTLSFTLKYFCINTALYTLSISVKISLMCFGERLHSGYDQQFLKMFVLPVRCDDSMVREGGVVAQDFVIHTYRGLFFRDIHLKECEYSLVETVGNNILVATIKFLVSANSIQSTCDFSQP